MPKEWRWVDGFRSPGVDSSGKHSSKCLKPSNDEPTTLGEDLVVHEGENPVIFLGPRAVEDAFEDDGSDDLPGGMCDWT